MGGMLMGRNRANGTPRALDVDDSGAVFTTGSGAANDALTNAQLRATAVPVSVPASELHVGETGFAMNVTAPIETTRTTGNATPYTINQRVGEGGAVTAPKEITGMARVNGGSGELIGLRISTNKKSITPRLRVHFFTTNAPTLAADNANWKELYADAGLRVGYVDMPAMTTAIDTAGSDCSRSQNFDFVLPYKCAAGSTSLFYAYETLDAFTPADGEKFSLVPKARLY